MVVVVVVVVVEAVAEAEAEAAAAQRRLQLRACKVIITSNVTAVKVVLSCIEVMLGF